jgi:hypothetical protein
MTKSRMIKGIAAALGIGGAVTAFVVIWRPAIPAIEPQELTTIVRKPIDDDDNVSDPEVNETKSVRKRILWPQLNVVGDGRQDQR